MKFIRLTNFKPYPEVLTELVDQITDTKDDWQSLDFNQYSSIVKMLSDNNIPNIKAVYLSTRIGPVEFTIPPVNEYNADGIHAFAPFRVYIPLCGAAGILSDDSESIDISEPTIVAGDKELKYSLPAGAVSHMLILIKADGEFVGRLRFLSGTTNKMTGFARFCGLV